MSIIQLSKTMTNHFLLGKFFIDPGEGQNTPTLIAYCLALAVRIFESTAQRGAGLVLKLTKLFGYSLVTLGGSTLSVEQSATLANIPESIQTLENKFNLNVQFVPYAICPTCNCTYPPTYTSASKDPIYPSICSERRAALSEPCGKPLLSSYGKPFKVFEYYPFWDWFGRFIALPGIEEYGDRFCNDVSSHGEQIPSDKRDASDGKFVHDFYSQDGKLFVADRGAEGRWFFTLNLDFFNVDGNRVRGRTSSTGMIAMTCLNLPLSMRNDHGFMYIPGLIPSHLHEPSTTNSELRYFLRPVVTDMIIGYERGVRPYATYKTRNDMVPYSRVHRVAIAAAPLDFKAARPLAGFRDVTSHIYCFVCKCWHKSHLGRTDINSWERVDDDFLRAGAEKWRDVQTVEEREVLEDYYGTRYSELWRLIYWKPSRQLAIDPMHAMYLIECQRYFREILGLDNPDDKKKKRPKPSFPIAFHYPFHPPPNLSTVLVTTLTRAQGRNPLNAMFDFEESAAEAHRLSILGWTHLNPDYLEARDRRLNILTEIVANDRKSYQGIMHILNHLSKKAPRNSKAETTFTNALTNQKWHALRFVCENLAVYPDPTGPEAKWKRVKVSLGDITKDGMVEALRTWVSGNF